MKVELLALVALWLVVVYTYASPVRVADPATDNAQVPSVAAPAVVIKDVSKAKEEAPGTETGRQARQQPAPAAEDDDDDDDDDDDLDLDVVDDDDDDDDDSSPAGSSDDDDDDDDDYFGGLFDDILGGNG